ncbi:MULTISPECIES: TetR/AcrR family transcriptional regulator [Amycolatopsis]|uniref:TetR family transcriptional regulator n=1 Tax=Amycolatopsis dendrobii TaxID=2760662 RepID=A0A7W3ZC69_9PSEU|nr:MULTISPECIES: TetR/AcrR family transcriptional regulator [Amycolatopsis]MBB1156251.1 TetR family transcriptional regulator [Amycolatopsis dendrobii]UKD58776.1 TetR/AcrR family transcriptional regulator [Amycolatopsis sp. FU40]
MADQRPLGLRERKKLDTRKALSDAAVALMYERGPDNVVREDIAERAGVSLRTFSNYFATKYDAVAYRQEHRIRLSAELLRKRPADEPLWTALAEALIEPLRADGVPYGQPASDQLSAVQAWSATPEMRTALARVETGDLVKAIAERTGTQVGDLYPQLVSDVAIAAMTTVLNRFLDESLEKTVPATLRDVFARISRGLPPQ